MSIIVRDKKVCLRRNGDQNLLIIEGSPVCSMDYFANETVQLIMNAMQNGKVTYSDIVAYVIDNHNFDSEMCFIVEYAYNVLSDLINICSGKIRNRVVLNGTIDRHRLDYSNRIELAVTYNCNNKCYFCYADCPRYDVNDMSTKDWTYIIDKLIDVGVPHLIFTGGEATLREDLSILIKRGSKSGLVTGLVTNGRLLTRDRCYDLKRSGLDYVRVTVESCFPDSHDNMTRIKGSCVESWSGIMNCIQSGIRTSATITIMNDNVSEVSDTLTRLGSIGVSLVTINGLICSGLGATSKRVDSRIMAIACKKALNTSREKNMAISWVTPYCHKDTDEELVFMGVHSCSAAKDNITIQPDGSVIPCQSWFHETAGNILTDEWHAIWNHDVMEKARNSHLVGKCKYCDFRSDCDGGCPLERRR